MKRCRRRPPSFTLVIITALAASALSGCAEPFAGRRTQPGTSPAPHVAWTPPPSTVSRPESSKPSEIPPDLIERAQSLGVADLMDIALRNSTRTHETWARARSAAAALGSQRGSYYPSIALDSNVTSARGAVGGGLFTFRSTTFGPNLLVSYLLLDFGGRAADIEQARQALIAADWTHNQAIQDVVLLVERTYYSYVAAQALLKSERATLDEAKVNLDAATQRHDAGVATIADVLQAKTSLSQAQLAFDTLQGQLQTVRGALATSLGLPVTTSFEVQPPPESLPLSEVSEDVDKLIEQAESQRPDLAAARAAVAESQAHVRSVESVARPSLTTNLNFGRLFFTGGPDPNNATNTYNAALLLRIPIFSGRSSTYDRLQAQSDSEAASARLDALRQQVVLQVWTSYFDLKTATQRVATSNDLLDSARQSQEVASGRYKAGVGSILDLLTAQSQLESARAQQVQARTDWYLSLAQLAHDTGSLELSAPASGTHDRTGSLGAPPPAGGAHDTSDSLGLSPPARGTPSSTDRTDQQ